LEGKRIKTSTHKKKKLKATVVPNHVYLPGTTLSQNPSTTLCYYTVPFSELLAVKLEHAQTGRKGLYISTLQNRGLTFCKTKGK